MKTARYLTPTVIIIAEETRVKLVASDVMANIKRYNPYMSLCTTYNTRQ